MFPSQTSLIPVTVALARFLEVNGSGGVYPFWYLGTTPFKYLTGPVVPYLLVVLKKVIPAFSYFDLALVLIAVGFVIEAVGWGIFAGYLSKNRKLGLAAGILSLIMPWYIVSALGFSEVSAVLAGSFTPWVLLAFVWGPVSRFLPADAPQPFSGKVDNPNLDTKFKKGWVRVVGNPSTTATPFSLSSIVNGQWSTVFPAVAFAILLLTNSTASVPVVIGLILLSITNYKFSSFAKASEGKQISNLKKVLAVVLTGWLLTLWWYAPGYWLTVWGAPGIGGKNIFGVIGTLVNFLRGFLPVIAAVLIVFWKVKPKTVFEKFSLGWLVLFGSLTLFRFMADWDFWMDWTAWMGEVEVGVALLIAGPVSRFQFPITNYKLQNTKTFILLTLFSIYFLACWFLAWQNRGFWLPRADIRQTVEYKIANWLEQETVNCQLTILRSKTYPVNCPTVFLSGTSAFWLNSLVDVRQVRGGRDEGSVDSRWRGAVWEVRGGEYGRESVDILKRLGVDYLVVHTDESAEYYHDFKYPEKFEGRKDLEKVYDEHGDTIYMVSGT